MRSYHGKLTVILPLLLVAVGARGASGQGYPPAQGPLLAVEPFSTLPTFAIINQVKTTIQTQLDSINARIARDSDSADIQAHVSIAELTTYKPAMETTQYPDRPNENIVRIPFIVSYDVTGIRYHGLPYFSRKLGQSLEVVFACHNWATGQGRMRATGRADRPYLDGTSFGEGVLNFFIAHTLTDLVDSKLRAQLPGALTSISDSLGACNRLGVTSGTGPSYTDGSINFKQVRGPRPLPTALDGSVTWQKIKRLPARRLGGAVLYQEVEDVQMVLYANQSGQSAELLEMREGEERMLNLQPVNMGRLGDAGLVLIANVEQLGSFHRDVRFSVFTQATTFGHGTQKLVVTKTYWMPPQHLPGGGLTKPMEHRVDAYEITVMVDAGQPQLTAGESAPRPPRLGAMAVEAARQ